MVMLKIPPQGPMTLCIQVLHRHPASMKSKTRIPLSLRQKSSVCLRIQVEKRKKKNCKNHVNREREK